MDPSPTPNLQQPPPKKPDYKEQLYTPYGNKKDTEKAITGLLEELSITNDKYKEKSMKILIDKEIKERKASSSYQKMESREDIPIDGDLVSGSRLFMMNCMTCHSLEANNQGLKTTGPGLGLIYGRRSGADKTYQYSEALLKSNFVWTQKKLFDFIRNPVEMVPDVKCAAMIPKQEERADLVKFLKKFTKELHKNIRVKANSIYGREYVDTQISTRRSLAELEGKRNQDKSQKEEKLRENK